MAARSSFAADTRLFVRAWFRGCAQIAFCDSPSTGLLLVAGIALADPFAGLGALLGALFGTAVGRLTCAYPREEWSWGLAGFNPAIVGLMGGGFFAAGEGRLAVLGAALAASVALDVALRRLLARCRLPALSSGAAAAVYATSFLLAPTGAWFWIDAAVTDFVPYGLLGAALILLATAIQSPFAAIWAWLLAAAVCILSFLCGHDPRTLVGLWGITVPLASFGVHAVFLRGSLAGCAGGTLAALLGALLWIAWQASGLGDWLPPLVLPFILGVWLSMQLMRTLAALPAVQPARWRVVRKILATRRGEREVVALVQGTSDAPVSGFVSGAWLDPQTPRAAFDVDRLRLSPRTRQAFWDASARLRLEASQRGDGALWRRTCRLQAAGWIGTVIVQDVMRPPNHEEGRTVLALHGALGRARCLDCGEESPWPPMAVWRRCDLRCTNCQGPMSPGITPFGGAIDHAVARRLEDVATRCGLVLVLGPEAVEPATLGFLERVRAAGGAVAFVSGGGSGHPRHPADISLCEPPESFLAFLERSLGVARCLARGASPRTRTAGAPTSATNAGGGAAR